MPKEGQLTPKQQLFVQEYLKDKNGSRAARACGYSDVSAPQIADRLLKKAHIRKAIDIALQKQLKKAELTAQDIIDELRRVAMFDIRGVFTPKGRLKKIRSIHKDTRRAISSVETDELRRGQFKIGVTRKIKAYDKVRALELLGKHFKLFTDIHEVTGKDGGPLMVIEVPDNGRAVKKDDDKPGSN